jgi:hypothetical protein
MEATVGAIFRHHFDDYQQRYPQPLHKHRAVAAMIRCRTAEMGGHVTRCPNGHIEEAHYNSCKHRSCPQCSSLPTKRWLEKQKSKLLDSDHYHAIFTIPHYLIALWWCNQRLMADLLFRTATETLRALLADPKYLGATVGILATLHTWGRDLSRHPHLHLLITAGGWLPEGKWIPVSGDYLLPYRVVRKLFRAKYVAALRKAYEAGELQLPLGLGQADFERLLIKVGHRVKWNTKICKPYNHGVGVATYLARYARGGPLRNTQIQHLDAERIVIRYTDHRTHTQKNLPLSIDEFQRRILWHIPEKGQHVIRYYGLYHGQNTSTRLLCREHLGQKPEETPEPLDWQTFLERLGIVALKKCPICGATLENVPLERRQGAPPGSTTERKQLAH